MVGTAFHRRPRLGGTPRPTPAGEGRAPARPLTGKAAFQAARSRRAPIENWQHWDWQHFPLPPPRRDLNCEAVAKTDRDGVPSPSAVGGGTPTLPECRGSATVSQKCQNRPVFSLLSTNHESPTTNHEILLHYPHRKSRRKSRHRPKRTETRRDTLCGRSFQ